jgi:outer membrane protein assembly factor BamB
MFSSRLRNRTVLGLGLLTVGVFLATATAQQVIIQPIAKTTDEKKKEEELTDAFNFELDREAARKLDAIREYLTKPKKPWETICEVVQRLLGNERDTFVEIERVDDKSKKIKKSKVSLKTEVNRMIGTFDKEGRQMYQLMYGAAAEDKLKKSLENNDKVLLAEVAEQYLHTKAGGEAAVLLGTWHLDRGRYIMAALTFQKLQLRNAEDPLTPQVLFKAALAYKRLGEKDIAEGFWKKMKEAMAGKNELVFGEKKFTLEQLQMQFDKVMPGVGLFTQGEWTLGPGGNQTRNGQGRGSRPFMDPRFTFSLMPAFDKEEEDKRKSVYTYIKQHIDQALLQFENRSLVALPMFFPIASNGKVIFRTYDGVYCVATRADEGADPPIVAGEILWRMPCDSSMFDMLKDSGPKNMFDGQWKTFYTSQGPYGIWFENGLIGSMAHDGANVYFVDDIAIPPHPQMLANYGFNPQPAMFGPFNDQVYANHLVAVNLETGKLMWKAGGRTGGSRKENAGPETAATLLNDACFLGPPLPLGGKLYVMIEKEKVLHLVCLDPSKITKIEGKHLPELVWSQPLGSPTNDLWKDSMRRVQGLHLSYADGMLVCPTNAGAILGIDLLSHSLVWAHSYRDGVPQAGSNNPNGPLVKGGGIMVGNPNPGYVNQDRWRVGTPMISQGKVVFTAWDSGSIQCLDLRTGEMLWKSARSSDDLYVGGIFDDKVMIVSKSTVRFLKLDTKEINGERIGKDIPIGLPSGVGTASGSKYFLPIKSSPDTREPEIWTIDVTKGIIEAKTRSRKKIPAGNLIFFEGDVYSQNMFNLTAFPQLEFKINEMNKLLATNPNDPTGLAEKGDLLLDDGKLMDAINTLHKAKQNNPNETTKTFCNDKLYEAITELLQRDFQGGEQFLDEYKELCNFTIPANADAQKAAALKEEQLRRESGRLVLLAKGRERQGKLLEAFDYYMGFGTIRESQELVDAIDEPGTKARPDVWARGRISNMIRTAKDPEQKKALEARIGQEWEKVKTANDLEKLRKFVRLFGGLFSSGDVSRLALAEKLMGTNVEEDLREAQGILMTLRNNPEAQLAAQATEALARLFIKKGLLEDAVFMYTELGRQYSNTKFDGGKTGADLYGELVTDKRFLAYLEPIRLNWPTKLKATETNTVNQPQQFSPTFTIEPDGELLPFFQRHRMFIEMNPNQQNWKLNVVDRLTGETRFTSNPMLPAQWLNYGYQTTQSTKISFVRGHLLILSINHEVYAYDLADKKLIWKFDLFGKNRPSNIYPNQVTPDPDGGIRLYYVDGWTQKVGSLGVIESSYICLITRDGLVAINPADGKVLWTKSNVSARVQLAGDENFIYIYEQNNDGSPCPTRVVRALDGVTVDGIPDSSSLFANPRKLKVSGRNVLVFEENGNQKTFRMVDILTGKDLWKRDLDPKAIVLRSEESSLFGYVLSNGEVAIFDTRDGKEIFKSRLDEKRLGEHLDKVNEAVLLGDRDRFYIALNRPSENNNGNVNQGVVNPIRSLRINGALYCFDRKNGKRLWYTDEQFENQMIVLEQFEDLPVLLGAVTYYNNNNFGGTYGSRLIAIEKTTGKAKYRKDFNQNNQQFQQITTDPKTGSIELKRYDVKIRFEPEVPLPNSGTPEPKKTGSGGPTRMETRTVTEFVNVNGNVIPVTKTITVEVPVVEKK